MGGGDAVEVLGEGAGGAAEGVEGVGVEKLENDALRVVRETLEGREILQSGCCGQGATGGGCGSS